MKKVNLTNKAASMVEAFRDEAHTANIKSYLLDIVCSIIDEADESGGMSKDGMQMLCTVSDFNELITELSRTSEAEQS